MASILAFRSGSDHILRMATRPRSGKLVYHAPESLAVGQKQMGEVMRMTDRQIRNLKKAGKLDWADKVPISDTGGPANDAFVVQSGTAFREKHAEEVKQKHVGALGDHAMAGVPKKAITKKRNQAEVDVPPGGGTSATDITEITKK